MMTSCQPTTEQGVAVGDAYGCELFPLRPPTPWQAAQIPNPDEIPTHLVKVRTANAATLNIGIHLTAAGRRFIVTKPREVDAGLVDFRLFEVRENPW